MEVKCQCGTITFQTPTPTPLKLYHCHCTQCRHQSGSAFGTSAIFTSEGLVPLSEDFADKMIIWTRVTDEGQMDCYSCKTCGTRVMHRSRDASGSERGTLSIKAGCIDGLEWKGGVHIYTKYAVWPIPEGAERWEEGPEE